MPGIRGRTRSVGRQHLTDFYTFKHLCVLGRMPVHFQSLLKLISPTHRRMARPVVGEIPRLYLSTGAYLLTQIR